MNKQTMPDSQVLIYQNEDNSIKLDVSLQGETVWLSQKTMSKLFDCTVDNISLHLKNIFRSGELNENSVTEYFSATATDGKNYKVKHYNLDAIISVGYRVNSVRGSHFRIWATQIREIRLSEKFFYQKIKDIYTTSIDYDPKNPNTIEFFKKVQNKLLWAISEKTAAELVHSRADASLPFMGMQSFDGNKSSSIRKKDVSIAKNYLNEDEIKLLGLLVEQYLAFAETMANQHKPMYMSDWIKKLDDILKLNGREILDHAGEKSHENALEKSALEYEKFREEQKQISKKESLEELERDIKALKDKK